MGAIAKLSASLTWDLDDFRRGTSIVEGTFKSIIGLAGDVANAVTNAGKRMTAGITLPLAGLGVLVTKAASDAEELQSAFDVTFGMLFNQAAPTEAAAARMSQRFTELAQDAASFYNTDFDTAMGKIRSGLTGESEPLRDFGVFLTEAAVKAKALEMGLVSVGQELTEEGKIMVRATLITEGLGKAQGDVVRTSDSLANRVRAIGGMVRELGVEFGEYLEPYAKRAAAAIASFLGWISNLPEGVKRAAVGFGVFLAVLGPLSIALSALAVTILPLLLINMGPVFAVISAIINPIGTLVVMAGKLVSEFGGISAVLGKVVPLFLRIAGPIGIVIGLLQLFGDDIARGLQRFGQFVGSAIGDGVRNLFATLGDAVDRVSEALRTFMDSPIGDFLQGIADWVGIALEAFFTLAGYLTGQFITAVFEVLTGVVDFIGGVVETVVKLLTGDWAGAWDAAVQTVGRAIIRIGQWIENIWPWLGGMIQMLGRLTGAEISTPETPASPAQGAASGGSADDGALVAGHYATGGAGKATKIARGSRGRSGPTADELAERREEIRLEQALAVAREANDQSAIRALERQRDLRARIERYERAGLKAADARMAAERDMAEIDQARAKALEDFLSERRIDTEYQIAVINNDYQHLRNLDEELDLKDRINDLAREGLDLASAERIARADIRQIEEARVDAAARRLRDQREAHEFELAQLRGDDARSLRMRDESLRTRDRIEDLMDGGRMSRADAEAQAMREAADRSQAHMQGSFRDAFRNGLQAAMDGDLKGFFEGWMKERTFNALSNVLDRLADSLANLIAGGAQSGGLFGTILGAFGIGRSLTGGAASGTPEGFAAIPGARATALPKWNAGGSGVIKGHPGIDRNLLSLNGNPIAQVSSGELLSVQPSRAGSGGGELAIHLGPGLEAEWLQKSAGQTVQIMKAGLPGMMGAASAQARRDAARPVMPGGATG